MDTEDILDALDSNETPFKEEYSSNNSNSNGYNSYSKNNNNYKNYNNNGYKKNYNNFKPKPKQESLWDKTDFKPTLIDAIKLKSTANSYAVYDYVSKENSLAITDDVIKLFVSIAKSLKSRSYTFRHNNSADDKIANEILKIEGIITESYLPWGKFNSNITKPKRWSGSQEAYSIAMAYHAKFKELPPAIRAILASHVDALLGHECLDPVNFLLCWTECGSEKYSNKMDFKKAGNLPFILKICEDANIPVFNLKNKEALNNLKGLMS